ncbi:MAG: hypothetical protein WBM03_06535 [Steroidobacteraceae bacterium]
MEHIQRIREGSRCHLVMCEAKDIHAESRDIKAANERVVFIGGSLAKFDGEMWIERTGRKPVGGALLQE